MAEAVLTVRWKRCPTCWGEGVVATCAAITGPKVTCPDCKGECRVTGLEYLRAEADRDGER